MPPFDRHSKTSPTSKPVSGFDAPANSRKIARAPWEREDDDEFGPPPALDLSPSDAEAEAKRMVYETTHPLNPALMQNAHFDHNRAMRRYAALARRAWDPAARDIPVQPARAMGGDDLIRSTLPDVGKTKTGSLRPKAGSTIEDDSAQSNQFPLPQPKPSPWPQPVGSSRADQEPVPPASPPEVKPSYAEQQAALAKQDAASAIVATERREQAQHDRNKGFAIYARKPIPLPPHRGATDEFAEIRAAVENRRGFSPLEQYVTMRILGYEGLEADGTASKGGITTETLNRIRSQINDYRALFGRPPVASTDVTKLTTDEMTDSIIVYLAVVMENRAMSATEIARGNFLEPFGKPELAAQIADIVFNHKPGTRFSILISAINQVVNDQIETGTKAVSWHLEESYDDWGGLTDILQKLASERVTADKLLLEIQRARSEWAVTEGNYRWMRFRIWGLPNK